MGEIFMAKAQFFLASCDRMGATFAKHNYITRSFNANARILSWTSPASGLFLVKATEETKATDISSAITSAANVDVFVAPVDLQSYSFSLMEGQGDKTTKWIAQHKKL